MRNAGICGVRFLRQYAIGPFIVDFCAPSRKLVIELDGGQHMKLDGYDEDRSAYLAENGYTVLRFWNNQVMEEIDGVILVIEEKVKSMRR